MANVKELKRVRAHIRRYPEKLEMGTWICGTTACVAGRAALLNGWKPVYSGSRINGLPEAVRVTKDGKERGVEDVAVEILGLDSEDLFYCIDDEVDSNLTDLIKEAERG